MPPLFNTTPTFLPDAVSGGSCPTFLRTLRRFPFKDASQGPGERRERERRVQRKATLTSLLPLVLRLQLVPRPRQRVLPAPQSWRITPRSSSASLLCHLRRQAGKTTSVAWERPGKNNGKSCSSQRRGRDEGVGSEWDVAEKGQQRRKGHLPAPA